MQKIRERAIGAGATVAIATGVFWAVSASNAAENDTPTDDSPGYVLVDREPPEPFVVPPRPTREPVETPPAEIPVEAPVAEPAPAPVEPAPAPPADGPDAPPPGNIDMGNPPPQAPDPGSGGNTP